MVCNMTSAIAMILHFCFPSEADGYNRITYSIVFSLHLHTTG